MIIYNPLWETMKKKGVTTYTLREKYKISSNTVRRLKANENMSTFTLNKLCEILNCRLDEIAVYIPNKDNTSYK